MSEQDRADLLRAATYLEADNEDGSSMSVAEAERIAETLRRLAATDGVPAAPAPGFTVTQEERDAIKEVIAGLAFICEISDTGQLVDHAFNALEKRRNADVGIPQPGQETTR